MSTEAQSNQSQTAGDSGAQGSAAAPAQQQAQNGEAAPPAASASQSLLDAPQESTGGAEEEEGKSLLDEAADDDQKQSSEAEPDENEEGSEKKDEPQAPEEYADFTLPEGMKLDEEGLNEFKTIAKELKLTQEQAQKIVSLQAKRVLSMTQAAQNQWKETVDSWKKETVQTLGANYKRELSFAAKSRDRFASPELKTLLNETGLANHKEVISHFIKIGKMISEDSFSDGKASGGGEKSAAQILYPNHPSTL